VYKPECLIINFSIERAVAAVPEPADDGVAVRRRAVEDRQEEQVQVPLQLFGPHTS
jgi:hypothetical protein